MQCVDIALHAYSFIQSKLRRIRESVIWKKAILCCFFESNGLIHLHTCAMLTFQFGNKARLVIKEALNIWLVGVTSVRTENSKLPFSVLFLFCSYCFCCFYGISFTSETIGAMLQDNQKQLYWPRMFVHKRNLTPVSTGSFLTQHSYT